MRELHLVSSIKLRSGPVSVFKESSASWTRTDTGDYVVSPVEDPEHTYLVPASAVKHERREKKEAKKP
jgi:hypothetical protein